MNNKQWSIIDNIIDQYITYSVDMESIGDFMISDKCDCCDNNFKSQQN